MIKRLEYSFSRFTCAGDGEPVGPGALSSDNVEQNLQAELHSDHTGHHGWLHWFSYPIPDGGRPNTDLWPDVRVI